MGNEWFGFPTTNAVKEKFSFVYENASVRDTFTDSFLRV